MIPQYKIRIDF